MANSKKKNRQQKRLKAPRGQAMVEYSVVSHAILFGGAAMMLPIISKLFQGINMFYDSVYTVIETAAV